MLPYTQYRIGDNAKFLCRCGSPLSKHWSTSARCPRGPRTFRWPDWHTLAALAREG